MPSRSGWDSKSASYRSRLEGAGKSGKLSGFKMTKAETRTYWEHGGDLRAGRSHTPRPKASAAPAAPATRAGLNLTQPGDHAALLRWRRSSSFPSWLPRSDDVMSVDTAAILSQIDLASRNWAHVEFYVNGDGSVKMTVTPKHGYQRTVILPDTSSMREVGAWLHQANMKGLTVRIDGEDPDFESPGFTVKRGRVAA